MGAAVLFVATACSKDEPEPKPNPKPDPEGYLQAMRRLGVGPEEVVIIEDSVPGTDAASATGAVVLAVPLLGRPGAAPRRVLREGGLTGLDLAGLEKIWRNKW